MTSLDVFLFLYSGGPPLLGGCALRVGGDVCSTRRSGAGEGWGAWGGVPRCWCHGEMAAGEDLALVARWERQDIEVGLPAAPWSGSPRGGRGRPSLSTQGLHPGWAPCAAALGVPAPAPYPRSVAPSDKAMTERDLVPSPWDKGTAGLVSCLSKSLSRGTASQDGLPAPYLSRAFHTSLQFGFVLNQIHLLRPPP